MKTAEVLAREVDLFLKQLPYDRKPYSLYEPIKYVLDMGGKRMRPTLMLLAYNLYKDNPEDIMMSAAALETYHNYTLLHDDLMDQADMRRGHLTVHKKWDDNTAVLSGDTMLVLAYQRLAQCDGKHLRTILDLFTRTALEIGEGQQYDMEFESRNDVTEEEYIEMIRLKTSVLLACAMQMGAALADAPADDQKNLYDFGEKIGLAFQLQDDFLDVYGDERVFGKAIGGDITSNKKTYMLINALNRADNRQRDELSKWIAATHFDRTEKVRAVTRIYDELGIGQLAKEKIKSYFDEARKYLDNVHVDDCRKKELRHYAEMLLHRKK